MTAETPASVRGSVSKIIFHDVQSGFSILLLEHHTGKTFIATGVFPLVIRGHLLALTGVWTQHPRFGKQFATHSFYRTTPTSRTGLIAFLSSGFVKGIGVSFAEKLVDTFGPDILRIIDEEPHKLGSLAGLGPKRIAALEAAWREQKEFAHLLIFLQEKGVSATHAIKLYKQYREHTVSVLTKNPYQIIDDVWGISFTTADEIATKIGIAPYDALRIDAAIRHCLRRAGQQGHLYVLESRLMHEAEELLKITEAKPHLQNAIQELIATQRIILLEHNNDRFIALPAAYNAEKFVAEQLNLLLATPPSPSINSAAIEVLAPHATLTLNAEQREAIQSVLRHPITLITGGPGTGKTTLLSALLCILDAHAVRYKLAAPTGRAARRMYEKTKKPAVTLHRLLDFDPDTRQFRHNEAHPLATQVIIIDECSMVDIMLAQALLRAVPQGARLVLIGDSDQLPSVGPGNFLSDCLESKRIPTVRLIQIYRQSQGSMISYNAHRIREGKAPVAHDAASQTDFIIIADNDPDNLPNHLRKIIAVEAPARGYSARDMVVLCPMHRGTAGTQHINQFLQSSLNPEKKDSFVCANTTYKIDDRVMQLRNNYEKGVFNGDMGVITQIDTVENACTVEYEGRSVLYAFDEAIELTLAYATSIHKSQGSEFPIVVVPVFMQHYLMLRRNLLYTAITRAQKLCVLIGEKRAIAIALRPVEQANKRLTLLTQFLLHAPKVSSCV